MIFKLYYIYKSTYEQCQKKDKQTIFALMLLKTIIVEDNLLERETLLDLAKSAKILDVVNAFNNIIDAIQYTEQFPVDLILSDIMMEGGTGLDLIQKLRNKPLCVFVSSHTEYALEAYELNVIDFISKPITEARFDKTMEKIKEYAEIKFKLNQHTELPNQPNKITDFFYIKEGTQIVKINSQEVLYLESLGNFTRVYLQNGKRHVTLVGLKYFVDQLPPDIFIRVHRTFVVNINYVKGVHSDEVHLQNVTIPIGKTYKEEFINKTVLKKLIKQ